MRCKIFHCDKVGRHQCCASCERLKKCNNPCLNHPSRCGQVREATAKELISEHGIKLVKPLEAADIIETGHPVGLFYERLDSGTLFEGINSTVSPVVVREFSNITLCVRWLIGEPL